MLDYYNIISSDLAADEIPQEILDDPAMDFLSCEWHDTELVQARKIETETQDGTFIDEDYHIIYNVDDFIFYIRSFHGEYNREDKKVYTCTGSTHIEWGELKKMNKFMDKVLKKVEVA